MALLLVVNLLVKPFWILGVDRSFQNHIGHEQYGLYINMFSISLILTMILDFGINNFNSATIANDSSKLNSQFSSLFSLKVVLSSVYVLLTLVIAYLYGYRDNNLLLILLLAFNQITVYFSTFVRSCISGIQLFKTDAILSAVDRFVMILFGLLMLSGVLFHISIFAFIGIQTIGYFAVLTTGLLVLTPRLRYFKLRFDWELLKSLLIKTSPYALLAFIMLMYTKSDVLLMKKMLVDGDTENGIYASGGRLLEAANMMVGATAVLMLPFFAKMIAANVNLTAISRILSSLVLMPVIVFSITCYTYSNEIMQLLSPGSSIYTSEVFSILILSFIPFGFMYTYGSMLTAKSEMRILNLICAIALVVNIVLNLILIPSKGALGAAIAALITQSIVGFGKFAFALNRLKLSHNAAYLLKLFGFIPVTFALLAYLHQYNIHVIISLVIELILMTMWILALKMIDYKSHFTTLFQNIKSYKK